MALTQIDRVPYKQGYDFGIGVDVASGSPMNKVTSSAFSGVENALGTKTNFEIWRVTSTSQLEEKLGIYAEANLGCGLFGASARVGYAKQAKVQSSSLFMAITAQIELAFNSIDEPALTPDAAQLVSQPNIFSSRYGNMFVRGIGRGGLFCGLMQIDASSKEDSEAISVELEGSYGFFSAEAKTKFENVQKKYHCVVHIKVYHEGGPADLSMNDLTDPLQLYQVFQQWLKSFQEHPEQNAIPYYVTLAPITLASGPIPPNEADIQHAQDILVICAKQRSTILDSFNLMDHILQNPSRYEFVAPTTRDDIAKAFAGYQADLDLVAAAASQAMNDVSKAVTPAEFARQKGRPYPQGVPPMPMPMLERGKLGVYAAKGVAMADADPLTAALRNREPEGPSRRGFDIGMGASEGQTLWGPGKQEILDSLPPAERIGFQKACDFSLQRNNNAALAKKGEEIVRADETLVAARASEPAGIYWLGFGIATAIFGDPARGAQGNTQMGPGSEKVRSTLDPNGQRGFNAAVALHLSRNYR